MQSNTKNVYNSWAELMSDDEDVVIAETKLDAAIESGFIEVRNKKKKTKKVEEVKVQPNTGNVPASFFSETASVVSKISNASEVFKHTKLCNSVVLGESCKRREKCTYAHSLEQLRLSQCHFGFKCNNIVPPISDSDVYINNPKGGKVCTFIHPDEKLENYATRVFKMKAPEVVKTPEKKPVQKTPEAPVKAPVVNKWVSAAPFIPKLVMEEKPEAQEKIILDLPEKLVMPVLEMAIKTGKTNIEVRIH